MEYICDFFLILHCDWVLFLGKETKKTMNSSLCVLLNKKKQVLMSHIGKFGLQFIDSSYNKDDLMILSAQTLSSSLQMDLFDEA